MVKNYSFYQFIMTVRGRKDDKGVFAEQILKTLPFQNTKMILIHYLNILRHIANSPYQCLYLMTYMMTIQNG